MLQVAQNYGVSSLETIEGRRNKSNNGDIFIPVPTLSPKISQ
jgi:hypothetical protein